MRRQIASADNGPCVAGTEIIYVEFVGCFHDLAPSTGIDIQLHNPVRQPFLSFLTRRNCSDLTLVEQIFFYRFQMFLFIGRMINVTPVSSTAVRQTNDVINP